MISEHQDSYFRLREGGVIRLLPVQAEKITTHYKDGNMTLCHKAETKCCPLCDAFKKDWSANRILKPIDRHMIPVIDLNHPEKGPLILSAPLSLYKVITAHVQEHPTRKIRWWQFWKWIPNIVRTSMGHRTEIFHEEEHWDFVVHVENMGTKHQMIPSYHFSHFRKGKPIGSFQQIRKWTEDGIRLVRNAVDRMKE